VLFASHPASDERQAALVALAGDNGGFVGDAEYQARVEPFMADLLDDELKRAQYDESIVLFGRLAAARPTRGDLRFARGEAYRLRAQEGDQERAIQDLQQALSLNQPPPAAHRALGLLHRQQGRREEAMEAFRSYLDRAPKAPDAALIRSFLDEAKAS
jgi:tetratricopeptide (TPR) repeat protein